MLAALAVLGFEVVRTGTHIALARRDAGGGRTPMTLPNHALIKGSTLRTVLRQSGIDRDAFLAAYTAPCITGDGLAGEVPSPA